MALSGKFYKYMGNYGIRVDWTGEQNIGGNHTDITMKAYFYSSPNYYTENVYGNREIVFNINGDTHTMKRSYPYFVLYSGDSNYLGSFTKRVHHNADGRKSASLKLDVDMHMDLSGNRYETVQASDDVVLDAIPRESTLASGHNFTAGYQANIRINRASTSFTHTVNLYVEGTMIKQYEDVTYGVAFKFYESEVADILNAFSGSSGTVTWRIYTFDYNDDWIGDYVEVNGTVREPRLSRSADGFTVSPYIDGETTIALDRQITSMTHDIRIEIGGFTKYFSDVEHVVRWTPTDSEQQDIYAETPNSNRITGRVYITTKIGSGVVGSNNYRIYYNVRNSNPDFLGDFVYRDTRDKTLGVTDDESAIIQNESHVELYITSVNRAVARNGATIEEYNAEINGVTIKGTYKTDNSTFFDFGTINSASNVTARMVAIDSRGNKSTIYQTVNMIPYSPPRLYGVPQRVNNYESDTVINPSGTYSPINVNGVDKNTVTDTKFRVKRFIDTNFTSWKSIENSTSGGNISTTPVTRFMDNIYAFNVKYYVLDLLNSSYDDSFLSTGRPALFVDADKLQVSVNRMPTNFSGVDLSVNDGIQAQALYGVFNSHPIIDTNTSGDVYFDAQGGDLKIGLDETSQIKTFADIKLGNSILNSSGEQVINIFGDISLESPTVPSLQNGWENYSTTHPIGSGFTSCHYYKDKFGLVHIEGLIRLGDVGTIFQLPSGYRPSGSLIFVTGQGERIDINDSGFVSTQDEGGAWLSLAGISFRAYQ